MKNHSSTFNFKTDWTRKHDYIKKDPYRYILSEKEYQKCYGRVNRALFSGGIISAYLYYNIRHHQELGLVKGLKFNSVFYLQVIPKVGLIGFITFCFGYTFFVDFDRKMNHEIAKYEVQKFDPDWFIYDDIKYQFSNAPIHQSSESKFSRYNLLRGFFNYYQEAGYLARIKKENPDIVKESPPKYEFTPEGPLANRNHEEIKNNIPIIFKNYV